MTASVLRILLSLSVVWAVHITITPPQPPPDPDERVGPIGLEVSVLPLLLKTGSWTMSLVETLVTLASLRPLNPLSRYITTVFVNPPATPDAIQITWIFLVAWVCSMTGAIGRRSCYRAMQEMFTFELSLRKNHRLVTSGPYSIVRHPSYTSAQLALFSALTCYTTQGSWLMECSGFFPRSNSGLLLAVCWLVAIVVAMLVIGPRLEKEDIMLKERFGSEWETWATRVPYKLIPGLY